MTLLALLFLFGVCIFALISAYGSENDYYSLRSEAGRGSFRGYVQKRNQELGLDKLYTKSTLDKVLRQYI
jgi:hypothetical protein